MYWPVAILAQSQAKLNQNFPQSKAMAGTSNSVGALLVVSARIAEWIDECKASTLKEHLERHAFFLKRYRLRLLAKGLMTEKEALDFDDVAVGYEPDDHLIEAQFELLRLRASIA